MDWFVMWKASRPSGRSLARYSSTRSAVGQIREQRRLAGDPHDGRIDLVDVVSKR